jgi:hypothetical protein
MTVTSRWETKTQESPERDVYSNPQARKLLQFMLRSPRTTIAPEITVTDDIRYPELKQVVELNEAKALNLLSRMVQAKVLLADLVDKVPACPDCGSSQLSTRYICPKCFNYNIEHSFLYEHLKCGKTASDDTFKKGDQLVCPKCQTVLHNFGIEYRAVGAWYKCGSCNESFNAPVHQHFCRPGHHQFAMDRVRLVPIYQYRLNPAVLGTIRKETLLYDDAILILESSGLTVIAPGLSPGKSAQAQPFDIITTVKSHWGGSRTVAIDVIMTGEDLPVEGVRDFAAKVKDAKVSESYLIAVPGLKEDARALARNLRLSVIEAPSLKEAMTLLLSRDTFKGLSA